MNCIFHKQPRSCHDHQRFWTLLKTTGSWFGLTVAVPLKTFWVCTLGWGVAKDFILSINDQLIQRVSYVEEKKKDSWPILLLSNNSNKYAWVCAELNGKNKYAFARIEIFLISFYKWKYFHYEVFYPDTYWPRASPFQVSYLLLTRDFLFSWPWHLLEEKG